MQCLDEIERELRSGANPSYTDQTVRRLCALGAQTASELSRPEAGWCRR